MDFKNEVMRGLLVVIALLLTVSSCYCQTWNEWFKQKKTQKKYLLEQVAALRLYGGYVKKGIDIIKNGTKTISDIKSGDFNLHSNYFSNLKVVTPRVKNYAKIGDIISMQLGIVQRYNKAYKQVKSSEMFNNDEIDYVKALFKELLAKTVDNLEDLLAVTSTGILEMKDDERLQRIDRLYEDMQDRYLFTQHFCNQIAVLSVDRLKLKDEIQTSRLFYGVR